jgi:hypothetical protein
MISVRSLGGSVGLAIYNAISNNTLSDNLGRKVAAAVLPLGLPSTSIEPLIQGLMSDNETTLSNIDGASPSIIGQAGNAIQDAYTISFRYVWIAAGCFTVVAVMGKMVFAIPITIGFSITKDFM